MSAHPRILRNPSSSHALSGHCMSWNETSWSPHVCDRMVYGGGLTRNSLRVSVLASMSRIMSALAGGRERPNGIGHESRRQMPLWRVCRSAAVCQALVYHHRYHVIYLLLDTHAGAFRNGDTIMISGFRMAICKLIFQSSHFRTRLSPRVWPSWSGGSDPGKAIGERLGTEKTR